MVPSPHRHLSRLGRVWLNAPLYLVTTCTAQRIPILANPVVVKILEQAWGASRSLHGWVIGRYVVMPDHVHWFCGATEERKGLADFVRDWKKWTARRIKQALDGSPVWQAEFFDHLLRSGESYDRKWEYVRMNPVRAGLVSAPDQWPYAGEIESLPYD